MEGERDVLFITDPAIRAVQLKFGVHPQFYIAAPVTIQLQNRGIRRGDRRGMRSPCVPRAEYASLGLHD